MNSTLKEILTKYPLETSGNWVDLSPYALLRKVHPIESVWVTTSHDPSVHAAQDLMADCKSLLAVVMELNGWSVLMNKYVQALPQCFSHCCYGGETTAVAMLLKDSF